MSYLPPCASLKLLTLIKPNFGAVHLSGQETIQRRLFGIQVYFFSISGEADKRAASYAFTL